MEVVVRYLDELEDSILVFLMRLTWQAPQAQYSLLLACLSYAGAAQVLPATADAPDVAHSAPSPLSYVPDTSQDSVPAAAAPELVLLSRERV